MLSVGVSLILGHGVCVYLVPLSSYSKLFVESIVYFNLPYLNLAPHWGWRHLNFTETFGIRRRESVGYRVLL